MHVDVTSLLREPIGTQSRVKFDVGFQRLSDDLTIEGLSGIITLLRSDREVVVQGVLDVSVSLECGRCLEPVQTVPQVELDERFALSVRASEKDQVLSIGPDHCIDLRPVLRELVVVSTPMHVLCASTCQGLCPSCGKNLNEGLCGCETDEIDPRLAVLKALVQ